MSEYSFYPEQWHYSQILYVQVALTWISLSEFPLKKEEEKKRIVSLVR